MLLLTHLIEKESAAAPQQLRLRIDQAAAVAPAVRAGGGELQLPSTAGRAERPYIIECREGWLDRFAGEAAQPGNRFVPARAFAFCVSGVACAFVFGVPIAFCV